MKVSSLSPFLRLLVLVISFVTASPAVLLDIGVLVVQPGINPGTSAIYIYNNTGAFAAPPDFPVVTPVTFRGLQFSVQDVVLSLLDFFPDDLAPGVLSSEDPAFNGPFAFLDFPDEEFILASLSFTVDPQLITLADFSQWYIDPASITVTLLPLTASHLQSGDFRLIQVEATQVVPEPASWLLAGAGIGLLGFRQVRRYRSTAPPRLCESGSVLQSSSIQSF